MTKSLTLLTIISMAFLTTSCNDPKSGLYLTSQVESNNSLFKGIISNDTLDRALKNTLTGLKYQITIKDKYTILKSVATGNEFVLARVNDSTRHRVYSVSKEQDSTTVTRTVLLLEEDEVLYQVLIKVPNHVPRPLESGNTVGMAGVFYSAFNYGEAVVHLNLLK